MDKSDQMIAIMRRATVIAAVTVDDPVAAIGLSRALVRGGLPVIEILLRTPRAMECLEAVAGEVEGVIAGAGTVLNESQIKAAEKAGADFMVSPGGPEGLLEAAAGSPLPLLPGAVTATEIMRLAEAGLGCFKFFPAEASGGVKALKAIIGPLPGFAICPTGGINASNASTYLAIESVACVGGSWVAPQHLVEARDWQASRRSPAMPAGFVLLKGFDPAARSLTNMVRAGCGR